MSNIGTHANHKLLSCYDNEPLRYDYHIIDIIAHHYLEPSKQKRGIAFTLLHPFSFHCTDTNMTQYHIVT